MGIPISGRLYEEFIPPCFDVHGHLETLYTIYASLCPSELQPGLGLVSPTAWLDHFFDDKADSFGSSLLDGFANPKDPLLQKLRFHVAVQGDRLAAILGAETLSYRSIYPSTVYRAAFITAWLCTYCIPVEAGQYIRPGVFQMAVQISEGIHRAIGVASLAFLYNCLDNIHDNIISGTRATMLFGFFKILHSFVIGFLCQLQSQQQSLPLQVTKLPRIVRVSKTRVTSYNDNQLLAYLMKVGGKPLM
ncbi:hypothetical protein ZEAMMB73_Zm00001d028150 [Zea mays]|uniref:Aminotransferase-like plant mobile domain-containing protein n=1 Tax=Zea mays TaxID=4577 RepID=A0A1D6JSE5_MAIZE|nr:hypothetical protein ZEAMMB73_Zm00001d028150 [Zea mays]